MTELTQARALWRLVEPLHAVVYFAPEPLAALDAAGYRGFWMGYFAGRAAPLGAVGADVVHAAFYNFAYERVAKALPAAWDFAPPEAALRAREHGAVAALRRQLAEVAEGPAVARAAELASRAAAAVPLAGRVLGAANHALPVPEQPLARLWHAATVLREHRGDGHIAALLAAGIGGRESHVFHAAASGAPRRTYGSRAISPMTSGPGSIPPCATGAWPDPTDSPRTAPGSRHRSRTRPIGSRPRPMTR
jgi:hypothetical protein